MSDTLHLTETEGERFSFIYASKDDDTVLVGQKFEFARLDDIAFLFQRFLLAAGYTYVTNVTITTSIGVEWAADGGSHTSAEPDEGEGDDL